MLICGALDCTNCSGKKRFLNKNRNGSTENTGAQMGYPNGVPIWVL